MGNHLHQTPHRQRPTNPTASRGQYGNNITSTNPASDSTPNQATGPMAQPQAWAHSFRLASNANQPALRRPILHARGQVRFHTCL